MVLYTPPLLKWISIIQRRRGKKKRRTSNRRKKNKAGRDSVKSNYFLKYEFKLRKKILDLVQLYLCVEVKYLLYLKKTEILVNSIENFIYRERLLELKKKQFYRKMQKEKEESGEDGLLKQIDGKFY